MGKIVSFVALFAILGISSSLKSQIINPTPGGGGGGGLVTCTNDESFLNCSVPVIGMGALTGINAPNGAVLSGGNGYGGITALGPDASTVGNFFFQGETSTGGSTLVYFTCLASTAACLFSGNAGLPGGGTLQFASDNGISRTGADQLAFGNGTQGDATGTLVSLAYHAQSTATVSTSGITLANSVPLAFSSTSNFSGTKDVGLDRASAGVARINNGAVGNSSGSLALNHIIGGGTAPSVVVGPGAGTGAAAVLGANSHDSSGSITITTGTASLAGNMAVLTFGTTYASSPHCILSSGSGDAALNNSVVFSAQNATTMTIATSGALLGTSLVYNYMCEQ